MYLQFDDEQGFPQEYELTDKPITVGRSRDADIQFFETKLSREHFGIRFEGNQYILKDLDSKNGTYVNGKKVDSAVIKAGDVIKVGSISLNIVNELEISSTGAFRDVNARMDEGAGYNTILREIVKDVKKPGAKNQDNENP